MAALLCGARSAGGAGLLLVSAVAWSLVPLVVALSGEGNALWWALVYFASEGAALTAICGRSPGRLRAMLAAGTSTLRGDRTAGAWMGVVLVGQASIPLFVWTVEVLGPAMSTVLLEMWPVALAVLCVLTGRGLQCSVRRFAVSCCSVAAGMVLLGASKGGLLGFVSQGRAGVAALGAGAALPVLTAMVVIATLRFGERVAMERPALSNTSGTGATSGAWGRVKSTLVPIIMADIGAVAVLGILIAAVGSGEGLTSRTIIGATIAGAVLAPAHTVLIRVVNLRGKASASNLLLAAAPVLSLIWLAAFVSHDLGNRPAFLVGAGLIIAGGVTAQQGRQKPALGPIGPSELTERARFSPARFHRPGGSELRS